jgi:ubiquinone/menaquinone biosynthesis C-methylase UbiE
MYRGEPTVEFRTLADLLRPIAPPGVSVLEIGCASGYYYEILEYLLNRRIDYTGVDYSEALITMARDYYPRASFWVADGASLFFADRLFDIVISSCILLHVPNYRDHIAETCRVSGTYTVLHRTPVSRSAPTRYLKKYAYGVETVELIFNEEELLREFSLNGFEEEARHEYQADAGVDIFGVTYLLRRTIGGKNVLG